MRRPSIEQCSRSSRVGINSTRLSGCRGSSRATSSTPVGSSNGKRSTGKGTMQARLVVRGFKDTQAEQLSTFAGTTSRWGQRVINCVAAQYRWRIFSADVPQAFLRGLTFKEAAEMKYEVRRDVQLTVPPCSAAILNMLPGYESFDPLHEVLRMLRCGLGAPHRTWTAPAPVRRAGLRLARTCRSQEGVAACDRDGTDDWR